MEQRHEIAGRGFTLLEASQLKEILHQLGISLF